jgi:hypothetical protein
MNKPASVPKNKMPKPRKGAEFCCLEKTNLVAEMLAVALTHKKQDIELVWVKSIAALDGADRWLFEPLKE